MGIPIKRLYSYLDGQRELSYSDALSLARVMECELDTFIEDTGYLKRNKGLTRREGYNENDYLNVDVVRQ